MRGNIEFRGSFVGTWLLGVFVNLEKQWKSIELLDSAK